MLSNPLKDGNTFKEIRESLCLSAQSIQNRYAKCLFFRKSTSMQKCIANSGDLTSPSSFAASPEASPGLLTVTKRSCHSGDVVGKWFELCKQNKVSEHQSSLILDVVKTHNEKAAGSRSAETCSEMHVFASTKPAKTMHFTQNSISCHQLHISQLCSSQKLKPLAKPFQRAGHSSHWWDCSSEPRSDMLTVLSCLCTSGSNWETRDLSTAPVPQPNSSGWLSAYTATPSPGSPQCSPRSHD